MSPRQLDFEDVVKHIGQFGPWQRWIFFWMCLVSVASGLFVVVYVFTGYEPKYRCAVPLCENASSAIYGVKNESNYIFSDYVMAAIPSESRERSNLCQYYGIRQEESSSDTPTTCEEYIGAIESNQSYIEILTCTNDDLVFDTSIVSTSVVTKYGLTCESSFFRNIYGSTYMIGLLFGSFILGIISDHFGRMTALMIAISTACISGFICAFMPLAPLFGFFRFLTGIGGMGCFMISFVICVECVGVKYTMLVGIIIEIPFAIGELLLGLEAYFLRDFFPLQLVAHTPLLFLLGLWFVVPESPRWLMAMGKFDKAEKIVKNAAKENKTDFPAHLFAQAKHQSNCKTNPQTPEDPTSSDAKVDKATTFFNLFYPKIILGRSLNMFYQWFSVTLCYYGLSYASTSLLGDPYTNFSLSVFIEIPGYLFCVFVMDCWGRRPILSFTQIVSGIACIVAGVIVDYEDLAGLQLFMSLIGKFGASASFAIIYVYTAELFPTVIRNTAIGSCSTVARFGAIFALLIGLLGGSAPMLILGVSAVIGGILALFFPETVGLKLPQTMEDALNIGKDSERGICSCICPASIDEMFSEDGDD